MSTSRVFAALATLALAAHSQAQTPPTTYTITQGSMTPGDPSITTIYRDGEKSVWVRDRPAHDGTPASRIMTFYDLKTGTSYTWEPVATPVSCNAGRFSGDSADPFAMSGELKAGIAKGDFKPAGAETLNGIPTKVYTATTDGNNVKVWYDDKDGLVIRTTFAQPNAPVMTMIDIRKLSLAPPPALAFRLPPACAGVHPPPTPAEVLDAETGGNAVDFVNATAPGPAGSPSTSRTSCSVVLRIVNPKTMTPMDHKYQVAIDTTFNVDNPPHYEFGVGADGVSTFAGGGLHEITSQIRNGMLRIDNPPAYFNLSLSFMKANEGANAVVVYRQCFAPVTVLYFILKNPDHPGEGGDYLWAKSGKYATVPPR